jgi:hypothetical protein
MCGKAEAAAGDDPECEAVGTCRGPQQGEATDHANTGLQMGNGGPQLLDLNEDSLARRKREMIESVGVGDQYCAFPARPSDDRRACDLQLDVRRLDRFQLTHVDDRERGCGAVFFRKTTDQQRVVALNLLNRRECPNRVAEFQVRRIVRAVMGERADVLIPDEGIGDFANLLEDRRGVVPGVRSIPVDRDQ